MFAKPTPLDNDVCTALVRINKSRVFARQYNTEANRDTKTVNDGGGEQKVLKNEDLPRRGHGCLVTLYSSVPDPQQNNASTVPRQR